MEKGDSITLNGDVPKYMKLLMLFIDRVGFPVLAFILMFWLSYNSIGKMTTAIADNSKVLAIYKASSDAFQTDVKIDHAIIKKCMDDSKSELLSIQKDVDTIKQHSYGYQDYIKGDRITK